MVGIKNVIFFGVLYFDCLRDENIVFFRLGMVSVLLVLIYNCLIMIWVGDVVVYYENLVLNLD